MTSAARKFKHHGTSEITEASARANAAMMRYAQGDDDAFAELYEILRSRLYRLCLSLCGESDAEELMQEVFLKMHRARASFAEGGGAIAWAFTIARTTHVDRVRYARRRPMTPLDHRLLDMHVAIGCDPESLASACALSSAIECQVEQLSDNLRAAFLTVRVKGLSYADASAALDISVDAVKQRVSRACGELKAVLSDPCQDAA